MDKIRKIRRCERTYIKNTHTYLEFTAKNPLFACLNVFCDAFHVMFFFLGWCFLFFFFSSIFKAYYSLSLLFSHSLWLSVYIIFTVVGIVDIFCLRNNVSTDIKLMVIWWSFFLSLFLSHALSFCVTLPVCVNTIMMKTCSIPCMFHFMFWRCCHCCCLESYFSHH